MQKPITEIKNSKILDKAIAHFKEKGIILPTFKEQQNPELIPEKVINKLKGVGLWDINPYNLFRINWKNKAVDNGGLFDGVNYVELPREITGVDTRIVLMIGKYFPTGAHKVGAAYGCLAPRVITGEFDPTYHKAVWPSTGNYCRGGAFDSKLMDTESVAILPEEMSQERFEWLRNSIGSEVIATPGCESNVKEIYDKCWEIKRTRKDCMVFNQFEEFGNCAWHYNITGPALEEVFNTVKNDKSRFAGYISATGSAGTIAGGDYLRTKFPQLKVVASEALQCPTLLMNGFGGHRIEGIGDKHVPWIHNVKNTNAVTAIDDEDCMRILRLFNEPEGHARLKELGVADEIIAKLHLIGISGISNMLSAIKTAKYFDLNADDVLVTIATDSADMYKSRVQELKEEKGAYSVFQASLDFESCLAGQKDDNMRELGYKDQKAIHNLKYFTWVEQQGKSVEELNQLWYDHDFWPTMFNQVERWDELINEFNEATGLLQNL